MSTPINFLKSKGTGELLANLIDTYYEGENWKKEMLKKRALRVTPEEVDKLWETALTDKEKLTAFYYNQLSKQNNVTDELKHRAALMRAQHLFIYNSMIKTKLDSVDELKSFIEIMELATFAYCTVDLIENLVTESQLNKSKRV